MLTPRLPEGGLRLVAAAALCALSLGILLSLQATTEVQGHDVVQRVDPWGERGVFSYAPLRDDGSELAMGEPGYFTTDAPRLRVGFDWTIDDARAERVTAVGEVHLVVRHEAGGRGAWSETVKIGDATYDGDADGALSIAGEVDLVATQERIEAAPGRDAVAATWSLVANVRFASAPVTEHKSDASEFVLPLRYTPPLYSLPGEDAATVTKDHARTQTIHHDAPSPLATLASRPLGPALAGVGLVGFLLFLRDTREEEQT